MCVQRDSVSCGQYGRALCPQTAYESAAFFVLWTGPDLHLWKQVYVMVVDWQRLALLDASAKRRTIFGACEGAFFCLSSHVFGPFSSTPLRREKVSACSTGHTKKLGDDGRVHRFRKEWTSVPSALASAFPTRAMGAHRTYTGYWVRGEKIKYFEHLSIPS